MFVYSYEDVLVGTGQTNEINEKMMEAIANGNGINQYLLEMGIEMKDSSDPVLFSLTKQEALRCFHNGNHTRTPSHHHHKAQDKVSVLPLHFETHSKRGKISVPPLRPVQNDENNADDPLSLSLNLPTSVPMKGSRLCVCV